MPRDAYRRAGRGVRERLYVGRQGCVGVLGASARVRRDEKLGIGRECARMCGCMHVLVG